MFPYCKLASFVFSTISMYRHASGASGSAPHYHNEVSHNLFAGGGSCLPFVKNATPVKHNKVDPNKAKCHETRDTSPKILLPLSISVNST